MKDSFNHFELKVQCLCVPDDFKKNRDKLKDVDVSNYDTLIFLLQTGVQLKNAIMATEKIFELSVHSHLTQPEILDLLPKFRLIIAFIDGHF